MAGELTSISLAMGMGVVSGGVPITSGIFLTGPTSPTDDSTPDVTGYVINPGGSISGITVSVYVDGVLNGTTVTNSSGNFTYTITPDLASATYTISASADLPGPTSNSITVTVAAQDPATIAYLSAVSATGYTPNATWAGHIDTLIKALKAGGAWQTYDVIMVLAVPDSRACLDLKTPSRSLTPTNGPVFTADRGFAGNGTNAEIAFNPTYNPGDGGTYNLVQDSAHLGVYALTEGSNTSYHFGQSAQGSLKVRARANANSNASVNNSGTSVASTGTQAMPRHVVGMRRDNANQLIFSEGVQNNSISSASAAVLNAAWRIFKVAGANYTDAQIAIVHSGGSQTAQQALAEHNAMKAYLQARGAVA